MNPCADINVKPTFILGVGAQKAGTTWLHQCLQSLQQVNLGSMKEYHVWDAIYSQLCSGFLVQGSDLSDPKRQLRRELQASPSAYRDYFLSLVSNQAHVTGDLTPSYSLLDAEAFCRIRELLCDFDLKVVFLMRDPVERNWAMVRMYMRNNGRLPEPETLLRAQTAFLENIEKPYAYERTNYPRTLEALGSIFDKEQLYIGFYESLFEPQNVDALSRFLGLRIDKDLVEKRINASPWAELPLEIKHEAKHKLSHIYEYCAQRFVQTQVLWGENAW